MCVVSRNKKNIHFFIGKSSFLVIKIRSIMHRCVFGVHFGSAIEPDYQTIPETVGAYDV